MKRFVKSSALWIVALSAFYLLAPDWRLMRAHARIRAVSAQIEQLETALGGYHLDTGQFPSEAQGLEALRSNPGVEGWRGPYLQKEIPRDPWGAPYVYQLIAGKGQVADSHSAAEPQLSAISFQPSAGRRR